MFHSLKSLLPILIMLTTISWLYNGGANAGDNDEKAKKEQERIERAIARRGYSLQKTSPAHLKFLQINFFRFGAQKDLKTHLSESDQQKFKKYLQRANTWINSLRDKIPASRYQTVVESIQSIAFFYYYYDHLIQQPAFSLQTLLRRIPNLIKEIIKSYVKEIILDNVQPIDEAMPPIELTHEQVQKIISHIGPKIFHHLDHGLFGPDQVNLKVGKPNTIGFRWPIIEYVENIIPQSLSNYVNEHTSHQPKITLYNLVSTIQSYLQKHYNENENFIPYFRTPWEQLVPLVTQIQKEGNNHQKEEASNQLAQVLDKSGCYVALINEFSPYAIILKSSLEFPTTDTIESILKDEKLTEDLNNFLNKRCQHIFSTDDFDQCESLSQQQNGQTFCQNIRQDFINYMIQIHEVLEQADQIRIRETITDIKLKEIAHYGGANEFCKPSKSVKGKEKLTTSTIDDTITPMIAVTIPKIGDEHPFRQKGSAGACNLYSSLFAALQIPALRVILQKNFKDTGDHLVYTFGEIPITITKDEARETDKNLNPSPNLYVNGFGRALKKYIDHYETNLSAPDSYQIVNFHGIDLLFHKPVEYLTYGDDVIFSNEDGVIYKGDTPINLKSRIISAYSSSDLFAHGISIYYDEKAKQFKYFDNLVVRGKEGTMATSLTSDILSQLRPDMTIIG